MQEERKELIMQVNRVAGAGSMEAMTRAVQELDPTAEVEVDPEHGRATIRTCAQSLEVAEALNKAGYEATGMTL